MKFTCTQENLNRGLQIVGRVASRNVTLPILNNVLIQAATGAVRLCATNLEVGITCTIRGKVETEGSFTVNARLVTDFVSLLPKDRIEIALTEKALHVTAPNTTTTIRGLPAEEFPLIPPVSGKRLVRLPGVDLKAALQRVVFASANDEARPEISGVLFTCDGKRLTLAATDSYRLAEQQLALSGGAELRAIVPHRALQEVLRVVGDGPVEITMDDNQARFATDDIELTTRLIEGQYPDYRQIIPQETPIALDVGREEFVAAIRQASLFGKQGVYDVTLDFDGQRTLTIRAASPQAGEAHTTLPVKGSGGAVTVVFNHRYLLDGLTACPDDTVTLGLGTPASPGVIRPKQKNHGLYLIMPIRQ